VPIRESGARAGRPRGGHRGGVIDAGVAWWPGRSRGVTPAVITVWVIAVGGSWWPAAQPCAPARADHAVTR